MGNCTNTKSSSNSKRTEKQLKAVQQVRCEIEKLKDEQLFNQALMKMSKLIQLLKVHRQENNYYQEVMEIYIEMGRINQDIVGDHQKAYDCFENAIEVCNCAYGYNNEIVSKVIQPYLNISRAVLEEANGPLKQKTSTSPQSSQSSFNSLNSRKSIKRSSTHATIRYSTHPQSLNIIMEESSEHEEEAAKNWDEKDIVNKIFSQNSASRNQQTQESA